MVTAPIDVLPHDASVFRSPSAALVKVEFIETGLGSMVVNGATDTSSSLLRSCYESDDPLLASKGSCYMRAAYPYPSNPWIWEVQSNVTGTGFLLQKQFLVTAIEPTETGVAQFQPAHKYQPEEPFPCA